MSQSNRDTQPMDPPEWVLAEAARARAPEPPRLVVLNRRRPGAWRVLGRLAVAGTGAGVVAAAMLALTIYTALAHRTARLDAFDTMAAVGVTRFEAADGSLVGERYEERRLALRWEDIPRPLALAFLAAEDARFFSHSGLDFRGIVRAMVTNLFSGGVKEGASTITQQLAKILVGNERSWTRKVKEAILARRMEDLYSKDQILTWYMNVIYLGHGSYGVEAAAQNYFRKTVAELSLAEMAILAGCPQSPSRVNPALDLPAAKRRMTHILDNMVELGWATRAEAEAAKKFDFRVFPLKDTWGDQVPDYTEVVRRQGARWSDGEVGWLERGLTITMAVDPAAQRAAHEALDEALVDLQKKQGWPGPLARVPEEAAAAFFAKNRRWVRAALDAEGRPAVGSRLLGRVAEVGKDSARVVLDREDGQDGKDTPPIEGVVDLASSAWAAPWTVQPVGSDGKRKTRARVSFGGKVKDLGAVLAVGDVVLVRVAEPDKPKAKKPDKRGKKSKEPEVAPAVTAPTKLLLEPVPMMEGALASTPLGLGGVEAMATGWDFDRSEVDRASALRQNGSTMKPIVYAKAYDLGMPPSAPMKTGENKPDKLAWQGLVESDNAVSEGVYRRVLSQEDKDAWRAWGERLGLPRPLEGHRSEVRGTDQTVLGMLGAYAIFGREGRRADLTLVRKVRDRAGRVLERRYLPADPSAGAADTFVALWQAVERPAEQALDPVTTYVIAKNLAAAVREGTGQKARALGREAAGKTGTLDYDVWFAGFTGERAAIAWLGADRRERTLGPSEDDNRVYGSSGALPMWVDYMKAVDAVGKGDKRAGIAEVAPPGVVIVPIDPVTGLLARPLPDGSPPPEALLIPHRRGTEPTELAPEPVAPPPLEQVETTF